MYMSDSQMIASRHVTCFQSTICITVTVTGDIDHRRFKGSCNWQVGYYWRGQSAEEIRSNQLPGQLLSLTRVGP